MLYINDKKYEILTNEIKYINSQYNKIKGYSILIDININLNNKRGYINIWIDFFHNKDFNNILNKKYIELPTELNSKIFPIEIYDTENFIDFIESEVEIMFGNITDNQIEITININDENIKLKYNGYLKLIDN